MKVHLDFETKSCVDIVMEGAFKYAMDKSTSTLCLGVCIDDGEVRVLDTRSPLAPEVVASFNKLIDGGAVFKAFNANFERQIWRHVFMRENKGLKDIPILQWSCVAAKAMACGLPASLDSVAKYITPDYRKDKAGSLLIGKLCKPRSDGAFLDDDKLHADLMAYCRQDVEVERQIDHALPDLIDYEKKVFALDQFINDRGMAIDVKSVGEARKIIAFETERREALLREATNGQLTDVRKIGEIKKYLTAAGHEFESLNKKAVADAVKTVEGDALMVLKLRQELGQSSLAKYDALARCVCPDGRLHGMLMYHAAHTGRWGGRLVQPQNLPRGEVSNTHTLDISFKDMDMLELVADPLKVLSSAVRNMFVADEGETLIMADYAAIEARVLMWYAGCKTGVDIFTRQDAGDKDADIYVAMAREIYGDKSITKKDKAKRQLGKQTVLGCVAKGSIVYSDSGIKTVESLTGDELLWDGEKLVRFQGLVPTGVKSVIQIGDLWLTPDHPLLTFDGWHSAVEIALDKGTLRQKLVRPSMGLSLSHKNINGDLNVWSTYAVYAGLRKLFASTNFGAEELCCVLNVLKASEVSAEEDPAFILISLLIRDYEKDGACVSTTLKNVVRTQRTTTTRGMALKAFAYPSTPVEHSWNTLLRLMASTSGDCSSIELIHTETIAREILDLSVRKKALLTKDVECFDISGSESSRFMVNGLVAHNCGYGMGHKKFRDTCLASGISISEELAERAVKTFRSMFKDVPALWRRLEDEAMQTRGNFYRNTNYPDFLCYRLPSGRELRYYKAKVEDGELKYLSKEAGSKDLVWRGTYGGRLCENAIQAMARDVMADAMLNLHRAGFKVVLTVHDEIVVTVPKSDADKRRAELERIMKTAPAWAKGLPLNVESEICPKYKK